METHVLRLGNYVRHAGKIIVVTSIFPKGINARSDPATDRITYIRAVEIEPLPLSTDLLRRFGFRQEGVRWALRDHPDLHVDRAVDRFFISIGRLGERACEVRYVHQLQNLFADGWGVELRLRR